MSGPVWVVVAFQGEALRGQRVICGMAGMTRRVYEAKKYTSVETARAALDDLRRTYLEPRSWAVVRACELVDKGNPEP